LSLILPFISTSCIVISAIIVAFGVSHIKRGNTIAHQKAMVAGALFAVLFFTIYLTRTFVYGSTLFAGPDGLKPYYYAFLIAHILLALVSAILGLRTLYTAFKGNFFKHKKLGPVTAITWFITAITGVTVYLLLYVIYPSTDTIQVLNELVK
jgi:putative membrane protein